MKHVLISKLLNTLLASRAFINLDFLLSDVASFDKKISFTLFGFATLGFLLALLFVQ